MEIHSDTFLINLNVLFLSALPRESTNIHSGICIIIQEFLWGVMKFESETKQERGTILWIFLKKALIENITDLYRMIGILFIEV